MNDLQENQPIDLSQFSENVESIDVNEWLNRINKAREKEKSWRERAKRCVKLYRDDNEYAGNNYMSSSNDNDCSFNILYSNTETLLPALFSETPKPDVRNQFLNNDKLANSVGQVIEKTLKYSLDAYNFKTIVKSAVKDYLLTGRGVARIRLDPKFDVKDVTQMMPTNEVDQMGMPVMKPMVVGEEEVLVGQCVKLELVRWDSFVMDPVDKWEDVNWVCFIHMLTKSQHEKYFPGAPLSQTIKKRRDQYSEARYQVYEVWDKEAKKVYFISNNEKPLKIMEDPFEFEDFYPIMSPLYSIITNETMVPIPEYTIYQAQASELNEISYRITDLIRAVKFIGIYDSQQTELSNILKGRDSQFFPVSSNLLRDKGISGIIDTLDTSRQAQVLAQLYKQRDEIKKVIYEVTGISDIIRGESQASETATAQSIKAKYAGLRLRDRRTIIDSFIVQSLRMMTHLICKFFKMDQLQSITGMQITPEMESVLKDDVLRSYKVDIETDSTILADMEAETQKRANIVASITKYIAEVSPLVAQGAIPMETAKALLSYALKATKISGELEDALDLIGMPPSQPQIPQAGMPPIPGMEQGMATPTLPNPANNYPQQPMQNGAY